MAINKRKVLEAARKFAQKGAKERALKEYAALLKADPRDAKLLLEIGDVHRRWGQVEEAVAQYTKVADQYKQEGFDARAVAVYKQILNLDAKRHSAHVSLSELYQRMGLDAEAVVALQTAADGFHKEGNKRDALELLRRMSSLDPSNTTSRMKVADLLRQEGMEEDAVSEYESVVEELERQGALDTVAAVYERILEIDPNRVATLISLARNLIAQGQPERAEGFARQVCGVDADVPEHQELLIDVCKALGRDDEMNAATRELAHLYKERGDDERAREILQRLPSVDSFELSGQQPALDVDDPMPEFETAAPPDLGAPLSSDELLGGADDLVGDESGTMLRDDDLLEDDDFLLPDEEAGAAGDPALDVDPASLEMDAPSEEASSGSEPTRDAPLPEGDPDQLFAEASVYLRYGKRDQAIDSLRGILAQVPDHRPALEKLGEAYVEAGATAEAVELWTRAADLAREADDPSAFGILRDRIDALDPQAAATLVPPPEADSAGDLDIDIDPDHHLAVGDEAPSLVDDSESAAIDFDVDIDVATGSEAEEGLDAADEDDDAGIDVDIDVDLDVDGPDLDLDDLGNDPPADAERGLELDAGMSASALESGPAGAASSTTAQQVEDDLEEAEFYFQQEMLDEAEAIYRRVLEIAPSHPSALLRMGEIAVARGSGPGASATVSDGAGIDFEAGLDFDDGAEVADEPGPASAPVTMEIGDDAPATSDAMADALSEPTLDDVDLGGESASQIDPTGLESPTLVDEPAPSAASPARAAAADDETFDLAAELSDSFDDGVDESGKSQTDMVLSDVENGFESIFSDFKKGVSKQLGDEDLETRYDLGIAYMEMGLHEDAIGEFQLCLGSDERRLNSLHMMGLCALGLGRAHDAKNHIEQALSTADVPNEEKPGLHFDLGRALQALGDLERAREAYETVRGTEPDYPGLEDQIASLDSDGTAGDSGEDEAFESFDDFIADIEAVPVEEATESLADVVAEVESELEPDAVVEAEAVLEPPRSPSGRKKKISFV